MKATKVVGVGIMFFSLLLLFVSVALADMEEKLTHQGNKARITVGNFKDKASGISSQEASAVGEMLSSALTNTDKFIVLASQEEVDELIDEIDLGQSGYVEEGRGPEKGLMEGADILVTGAVTGFEPDAGGGGGVLGGLKKKAIGGLGASKKTAKIAIELKLIDIRTRRIIKAMSLDAKSSKWKVGAAGATWTKDIVLVGGLGVYANEPMADAIREVLREAVEEIIDETPDEYYRYTGQGQYTQEYGSGGGQQAAASGTPSTGSSGSSGQTTQGQPAGSIAENMSLYTRYDFVPGNKVIFYDDLSSDEVGEFPYRWNLINGVYEIAEYGGEKWILATDDGKISPKLPAGPLPKQYTVEMEYYDQGPEMSGNYYYVMWTDENDKEIGTFGVYSNDDTWLTINGNQLSDKQMRNKPKKGVHTMRIMVSDRSIKAYVDEERVANVPKTENFNPYGFILRHRPKQDLNNPTVFRNFRLAEGGKPMRQQLDETGKIVTHGILFDVNSHKIKGESYKTLKEIGELLQEDPSLRLSIEGHTDSDGADDYNMDLSKRRAESVRTYLINEYGISADRLEAKGWGESKPIDTNDTSEGKANNRRVELVKI